MDPRLGGLTPEDLAGLFEMLSQMRSSQPAGGRSAQPYAPRSPGFYQEGPPARFTDPGMVREMDPERAAEIARMDRGFVRRDPPPERQMQPLPDSVLQNISRLLQRMGR